MTGNTVSIGMSLGTQDYFAALQYFCIIIAFVLGSYVSFVALPYFSAGSFRYLAFLMLVSMLLTDILVAQLALESEDMIWITCLVSFSMGMLDVITFKGTLKVHVSFMTGNLQKVAGIFYDVTTATQEIKKAQRLKEEARKTEFHTGQTSDEVDDTEELKVGQLRASGGTLLGLYVSYVIGAWIGSDFGTTTTNLFPDGNYTLFIPAFIIYICVSINEVDPQVEADYVDSTNAEYGALQDLDDEHVKKVM